MSNLADLNAALQDINKSDSAAIDITGAAIGTVADFAGGIGFIVSAIELVAALFAEGDQTQSAMQEIVKAIQNGFTQLQLDQNAQAIVTKLDGIVEVFSPVESVFQGLMETITAEPPVSSDEKQNQIRTCRTGVINLGWTGGGLGLSTEWTVVHDSQVFFPTPNYFYDGGGINSSPVFPSTSLGTGAEILRRNPDGSPNAYGVSTFLTDFTFQGLTFRYAFDPGADPNGLVFNYTYILPYYMRAIMIFMAVGASLDPNFVQTQSDFLRNGCIAPLLAVHDVIKGGIVNIVAPNFDSMVLPAELVLLGSAAYNPQLRANKFINTTWARGWDLGAAGNYSQPYGAVNVYSGFSAIKSYPPLDMPQGQPYPTAASDVYLKMFSKFLLRSLARSKEVYRGIGLSTVWKTINHLKTLVGDAPLDGPSFGDWSLREVFDVLGFPKNALIGGLSIGTLAKYLGGSSPTFTAQPSSLRGMLEGLPPDQGVAIP